MRSSILRYTWCVVSNYVGPSPTADYFFRKEEMDMGKYRDLSGQKFNRLNVIKPDDDYIAPSGRHIKRWICLCDCQLNLPEDQRKYISVNGSALVTGHTKSCGCYISSDEYK